MAESFAAWVRDEASDHVAALGDALRSVDTSVRTSAAAVTALPTPNLANTAKAMPSMSVPWSWRTVATSTSPMRPFQSRFAMICEILLVIALRQCWDPALTAITITISISTFSSEITVPVFANGMCASHLPRRLKSRAGAVRLAARSMALAQPRLSENQTVTAGPWAIGPNYKANKLQSCTMSRSDGELGITFVRAQDGLSVILESQKWKLHRGKAYPVRLTAGSRSVDAKARRGNEKCDHPACR